MFCRYCGKHILDDSVFCAYCGKSAGRPESSSASVAGVDEEISTPVVSEPVNAFSPVTTPAPVAHKKKKNKKIALIVASSILIVALVTVLLVTVIVPMPKYIKAEKLFAAGNYSQAYNIYVGRGNYWNSVEQSKECLYLQAVAYRNNKDWDAANPLFEQIKDYKDSATLIHYHNHTIIDSKKATCTDSGYFAYKCDCGDEFTKDIPAGHIYTSATCTEPRKCSNCGKTSGSALGHNTTAAKCSRCGKITFETQTYYGSGQDCVSGITLPVGEYNVKFTYYGSSNFVVWFFSGRGSKDLAANVIGSTTCMYRIRSYEILPVENAYFNVEYASGSWSITIEAIG